MLALLLLQVIVYDILYNYFSELTPLSLLLVKRSKNIIHWLH